MENGLIAYYPLNNNINDSSKNHIHGQLNGGTFTNDRFNNNNSALFFDGINDFASIAKFSKFIPSGDLTICFWAKSIKNASLNTLMLMPDNTSNRIAISLYYSHNGNGSFFWDYAGISPRIFVEPVNPNTEWEFFVAYFNSSTEKMGLLKNNVLLREIDQTRRFSMDSTKTLNLGNGNDGFYNGTLDDIRFYGRILTSEELNELFLAKADVEADLKVGNDIKIIPESYNPKKFRIISSKAIESICIYSSSGQLLFTGNTDFMDLSTLPSGMYYIRLADADNDNYTKKILL